MSRKALVVFVGITCLCLYLLFKSSEPKRQQYDRPIGVDGSNEIRTTPKPQTKLTDSLHRKIPAPSGTTSGTPILKG